MAKLRGVFTALVTPMHSDGSVDYDGFRSLLRFQLENGADGIVPLGTSGETPTLDEAEEAQLVEIAIAEKNAWAQKSGHAVPIILGAGSNNTKDAVRYVQRAKDAGADYALVVTPYYNKPSDEGIFRHFEAVSKIGIPVIVYNIAGRTGKNICPDLLCRIASLPCIAGVKEASGDINQMMEVIARLGGSARDFSVLSGDDALALPLISCGGDGVVSVVSNLAPALVADLVHAALDGDMQKAREIHYRLLPFFKAAFCDGNPVSIKYAMNKKGLPAGAVRLPLAEANDSAKKIIEQALEQCAL
ncbi:MAG: 4-hydroxy-tetrahydrodipicolinate synthase [Bacteroides sp.]|nr:4-hydroxy-tetrahydrodipicolinate synthase [Prevotella sp.]MCM1406913.1 4-hydroxy-tetrahydrodipicolinate synthase [Treponema brennaborense]MCM1470064.1 4-hydroxy-tetrahydrodipicolinate synthase [Bacteroides sp.]